MFAVPCACHRKWRDSYAPIPVRYLCRAFFGAGKIHESLYKVCLQISYQQLISSHIGNRKVNGITNIIILDASPICLLLICTCHILLSAFLLYGRWNDNDLWKTHKSKPVGCASLLVTWPPSSQFLMHFAPGYTWLAISTYRPFPFLNLALLVMSAFARLCHPCASWMRLFVRRRESSRITAWNCSAKPSTSKDAFSLSSSSSSLLLSPGFAFRCEKIRQTGPFANIDSKHDSYIRNNQLALLLHC